MLNFFYYLNHAPETAETAGRMASAAGIPVGHVVHSGSTDTLPLLRHQYSSRGNYPFCLALEGACGEEVVGAARRLLLLFFHPFYEYAEWAKPLFVYVPGRERAAARAGLTELFNQQRLEAALYFPGEQSTDGGVRPAIYTYSAATAGVADRYYRYCLTSYSPRDIFLLEDAPDTFALIQQADAQLRAEHPLLYRLADDSRQARRCLTRLSREKLQLAEESRIRQQLLEAASKQNEVEYILRFYRNEYEILPLWYKRLGHIIKVLQGKRSFRSLYDKSVKKYKE
ncbi:MAG TPA: hypothetical protein VKU83_08315 [Puia sp.]|nr:hypothetical protein [Puia sp.]